MVAKSGLIPSSPYPSVLTFGWCLDESGGMTMEMEMDFGEGGRGGSQPRKKLGLLSHYGNWEGWFKRGFCYPD